VGAAGADHLAKFRPIFDCAGPMSEGDSRAMRSHKATAVFDEVSQVLPKVTIGEAVAHSVVKENSVVFLQAVLLEDMGIFRDFRFESAGLPPHQCESLICVSNRGMARVPNIQSENQEASWFKRRNDRGFWNGFLNFGEFVRVLNETLRLNDRAGRKKSQE